MRGPTQTTQKASIGTGSERKGAQGTQAESRTKQRRKTTTERSNKASTRQTWLQSREGKKGPGKIEEEW